MRNQTNCESDLSQAENLINAGTNLPPYQLNSLKLFLQTLQVKFIALKLPVPMSSSVDGPVMILFQMSKMLLTGEIKSAKTILKNLQSTVTLITQESNSFIFCPEDNLKR